MAGGSNRTDTVNLALTVLSDRGSRSLLSRAGTGHHRPLVAWVAVDARTAPPSFSHRFLIIKAADANGGGPGTPERWSWPVGRKNPIKGSLPTRCRGHISAPQTFQSRRAIPMTRRWPSIMAPGAGGHRGLAGVQDHHQTGSVAGPVIVRVNQPPRVTGYPMYPIEPGRPWLVGLLFPERRRRAGHSGWHGCLMRCATRCCRPRG